MKLVTLNIWGGKLYEPLLDFVKKYSQEIDIFCFQEVYQDIHNNIFDELGKKLPQHTGYFAPHLKNVDRKEGLTIFIRKNIRIKECKNINLITVPNNLQYISFTYKTNNYFIGHFHGVWYPKTKIDTPDRIKQAEKIKEFLDTRKERKILCGDFNLLPTTKSIKILEKGMINLIRKYRIKTTRNKYYEREEKEADYVLTSPDISVNKFKVLDIEVSDHLPLLLGFEELD